MLSRWSGSILGGLEVEAYTTRHSDAESVVLKYEQELEHLTCCCTHPVVYKEFRAQMNAVE